MSVPPFLPTARQMRRLSPYFPISHGVPRVAERRVLSGGIYVIRHGLPWLDAPVAYVSHNTLYIRLFRWNRLGLFDRMFAALAAESGTPERAARYGADQNCLNKCPDWPPYR